MNYTDNDLGINTQIPLNAGDTLNFIYITFSYIPGAIPTNYATYPLLYLFEKPDDTYTITNGEIYTNNIKNNGYS
jgi:hypothetical protein